MPHEAFELDQGYIGGQRRLYEETCKQKHRITLLKD